MQLLKRVSRRRASMATFNFVLFSLLFFFSSRRRHTRSLCDWSSDVCSSDLHAHGHHERQTLLHVVAHLHVGPERLHQFFPGDWIEDDVLLLLLVLLVRARTRTQKADQLLERCFRVGAGALHHEVADVVSVLERPRPPDMAYLGRVV